MLQEVAEGETLTFTETEAAELSDNFTMIVQVFEEFEKEVLLLVESEVNEISTDALKLIIQVVLV